MFRMVSLVAFIAVIGGILLHHLIFACGPGPRFSPAAMIRKKIHLFTLLFLPQSLNWGGRLRKLAFLLGLLCFIVLLLTGFVPMLLGGRLHGYWLMLHATFAPVFIACVAVIAITGAQQYRLLTQDKCCLAALWKNRKTWKACWLTDCSAAPKAGFWILAALSLPLTLTSVISMTPLFGTVGQEWLFHTHRWCALAFALTAIITLYILIRGEIRKDMEITPKRF
jgi:hypothetical protein